MAMTCAQKMRVRCATSIRATVCDFIKGIDHIAYRVRPGEREQAVKELERLTPYCCWKTYSVPPPEHAKLTVLKLRGPFERFPGFPTALVLSEGLTKDTVVGRYVAKYGPRVHHTAYLVKDIERLVKLLKKQGVKFTSDRVIGARKKGLLQIFTEPCKTTGEIIEYIERFKKFQGFFLADNVSGLMRSTAQLNQR